MSTSSFRSSNQIRKRDDWGTGAELADRRPSAVLRRWRGRLGDQSGSTLVEVIAALAVFGFVLTAVLIADQVAYRDSANDTERSISLTTAANGVAGMVQLLDQAYHVNGPSSGTTSNWIDVEVRIPQGRTSSDMRVLFNCAVADAISGYRDCVRYEIAGTCGTGCTPGTAPTGSSGVTVVSELINGTSGSPVFTNLSTPSGSGSEITFGDVTVDVPSAGARVGHSSYLHQVVINNSFYLRNLDFGQ
jgi:hypothetical protein